ncbi:hypothetical protein KSX_47390 [Ktedonospora formicarum]|uniref:Uncharacterized protein n=1 Tax=Ktedonospora formicarum TaxID=2778364 RepID=A0A8J3I2U8_9CHLR|nr:hypothetical protein KSX_47390 [Ktedonospora formicarum]
MAQKYTDFVYEWLVREGRASKIRPGMKADFFEVIGWTPEGTYGDVLVGSFQSQPGKDAPNFCGYDLPHNSASLSTGIDNALLF